MSSETYKSLNGALLAMVGWTVLHVFVILMLRSVQVSTGAKKPNEFGKSRNAAEDSFLGRVGNSHANCLENLPLFACLVIVTQLVRGPNFADQAWAYSLARVVQGLTHWTGCSELLVTVRFMMMLAGLCLLCHMGVQILLHMAAM